MRLAGGSPAAGRKATIEKMATLADHDFTIFTEILNVREGSEIWRSNEAFVKLEQYLTSIEAVIRFVDRF